MRTRTLAVFLAFMVCQAAIADAIDPAWLKKGTHETFMKAQNGLKKAHDAGTDIMAPMVLAYMASNDPDERAWIAELWYGLGIESKAAEKALLGDMHTDHQHLRLQVQWAIGRVSNDEEVVKVLLDNMMHDKNPLFRDKSACALASDQIHMTPRQKIKLYAGLIQALSSGEPQVRNIAIQALRIQTQQDKGYNPNGTPAERQAVIEVWLKWLEEYKTNL